MAIFGVVPQGVLGSLFEVEIAISERGRGIRISGNIDKVVNEGTTRISHALESSGFPCGQAMYEVNLHPAGMEKCGTSIDLPVALSLLLHQRILVEEQDSDGLKISENNVTKINEDKVESAINDVDKLLSKASKERSILQRFLKWIQVDHILAVGELRFDGTIARPLGLFGMLASVSKKKPFKIILIPKSGFDESRLLLSHPNFTNTNIIPVENLQDAYNVLINPDSFVHVKPFSRDELTSKSRNMADFKSVKAQSIGKRALEVAAAGGHNVLMVGPPGEGKTMLLESFPSILPPPTLTEIFDINCVFSAKGLLEEENIIVDRPCRKVPATATNPSIFGGVFYGKLISPGEISLSHHGAMIMDELPQRPRTLLEELRTPIQDKVYIVAKRGGAVQFPCNFIFLGAMNPCPCGYYGEFECERCGETIINMDSGCTEHGLKFKKSKCKCTFNAIKQYQNKLSGPLLDRIDIITRISTLNVKERVRNNREESSSKIRDRVCKARQIQRDRYKRLGLNSIRSNADLTEHVIEYIEITEYGRKFIEARDGNVLRKVSTRKFNQILKVSRTIADLEPSPGVHKRHIIEAITMMGIYEDPELLYVVDERNIHSRVRQEMLRRGIDRRTEMSQTLSMEANISENKANSLINGDDIQEELIEVAKKWYWSSTEK